MTAEEAIHSKQTCNVKKKHVLIVDDLIENRFLTKAFFDKNIFRTHECENGLYAIKYVQMFDIDLIIMDVHMPIMNGLEATSEIRRRGLDMPIIFYSADVNAGTMNKAYLVGGNDFLLKPMKRNEFVERVNKTFCLSGDNQN